MNQRRIILEHRDALDQFEEAKSKQTSCLRRGTCQDETYCLICPARLEKERCKANLEEKSAVLKELNNSIVARNTEKELQMRVDRENQRIAKKARLTKQMSKEISKTVYNRKDLTPERYLQHKQSGMTDRDIYTKYNIPSGSFGHFKKELLAAVEPEHLEQLKPTEKEVAESVPEVTAEPAALATTTEEIQPVEDKEPVVASKSTLTDQVEDVGLRLKVTQLQKEYDSVISQLKQAIENNNELQKQTIAANNQLTIEQQYTAELKQMVNFLEGKLNEKEEATATTVTSSDSAEPNYKALYEQSSSELEKLQIIAQDRTQTIESLEEQLDKFIESNNRQTGKFRDYEILLLERLLQELHTGRK